LAKNYLGDAKRRGSGESWWHHRSLVISQTGDPLKRKKYRQFFNFVSTLSLGGAFLSQKSKYSPLANVPDYLEQNTDGGRHKNLSKLLARPNRFAVEHFIIIFRQTL